MDQSLLDGLEQLKNVGYLELSFEVTGIKVILGSLKSEDDILIARKMEELESEGLEYVQTYKLWMIAYSIVQLNDLDLRDVQVVPGKDKEKPVTKVDHLFEILSSWGRAVLNVCFRKYGELLAKSDVEAEKGVVFEIVDVDAEIKRLQDRIEALKLEKGQSGEEPEDVFSEEIEEAKAKGLNAEGEGEIEPEAKEESQ